MGDDVLVSFYSNFVMNDAIAFILKAKIDTNELT